MNIFWELDCDHLAHHGIKGQKWGVKMGPPYPLGQGDHSSCEKRLNGWSNTKADKAITEYEKSHKTASKTRSYNVGSTEFTNKNGKFVSGLTNGHDFDWKEVVGLALDSASEKKIDYYYPASLLANDSTHFGKSYSSFFKDERIVASEDLKSCNPGFGASGTTQNCAKASAAVELMLRGINICAGRQSYPSSVDAQGLWWKGAEQVNYDYDDCEDELKSYGPGTSGTLAFGFSDNSGHCVHWTNSNSGKFSIEDGQNARRFDTLDEMMDAYGGDKSKSITTYRLDNCEPNYEMMAQDSVVRAPTTFNADSKVYNVLRDRLVDTW